MTGYESKRAMARDKLEQRTGEKQMKAYCENCGLLQPASFRLCNDAVTGAFYEDLCCDTCHFIVATVEEREALAQPAQAEQCKYPDCKCPTENPCLKGLAQPAQEPVAWADIQKEAQQIVESKFLWKKFIDGTPLANDIAVWMADFAKQHTHPPQHTEQNFCPRCGKRTNDIHTCTPPQENT